MHLEKVSRIPFQKKDKELFFSPHRFPWWMLKRFSIYAPVAAPPRLQHSRMKLVLETRKPQNAGISSERTPPPHGGGGYATIIGRDHDAQIKEHLPHTEEGGMRQSWQTLPGWWLKEHPPFGDKEICEGSASAGLFVLSSLSRYTCIILSLWYKSVGLFDRQNNRKGGPTWPNVQKTSCIGL